MGLNGLTFWETLVTAQVAGASNTTGARASAIPTHAKYPLPGGFFDAAGKKLRIEASGAISTVITTPGTARFDVTLGGTIVFDGLAVLLDTVAAHVTVHWSLIIDMTCRLVGSAGNLFGIGEFKSEVVKGFGTAPLGVLTAMLPWNSAPAVGGNFNTAVSQEVDLNFTQTVATGTMTLHQYSLISPN